jgi:hypothetical protein
LLRRARAGESEWFRRRGLPGKRRAGSGRVTRERYPKLHIPYHSRWRHFEAGGVNRKAELERLLAGASPQSRAHAMIDLTVVSVLLDAGAGADWSYVEPATGKAFTRSEGLGVASFHAFTSGLFSSDKDHPLQVDANGLRGLVTEHLGVRLPGAREQPAGRHRSRAALLRRLGEVMLEQPEVFGANGRPAGHLRPARHAGRPCRAAHSRGRRA